MKNKGMIIGSLVLAILLFVFLQKSFNSIQKADIRVTYIQGQGSEILEKTADKVLEDSHVNFVEDTDFSDLQLKVLLIDHDNKSALMIADDGKHLVDYSSIPTSVSYCNTYIAKVNDSETMLVNVDELLGDPYLRTIAYAYHYRFAKMNTLNPETINYFLSTKQDEEESFLRYMMIESGRQAYLDGGQLDLVNYYFDLWSVDLSDDQCNNVVNYDFYDGFLSYVKLKVLLYHNKDYNIEAYLDQYRNEEGLYAKDDEFEVMGLIYCLLAEREGKPLILDQPKNGNRYVSLLRGSVIGDGIADEEEKKEEYASQFSSYLGDIKQVVDSHRSIIENGKDKELVIRAEDYRHSIKVSDGIYIYTDYRARLDDGKLIRQDYQVVKVTPLKVYYLE